jgi:hypothetical protein
MALAVAIGAVATTVVATPAHAAASAADDTLTFTPAASGIDGGIAARAAGEDPPEIICRIQTTNPYVGQTRTGLAAVMATGVTRCSSKVAEIRQTHTLYWGGTRMSQPSVNLYDTREVPTYPDGPCAAGPWTSYVQATIYAPAGYYPPSATIYTSTFATIFTEECVAITTGGSGGGGGGGCVITCPIAPDGAAAAVRSDDPAALVGG